MRFIVYGAGAIGGVLGGRLAQAGQDVVLVARGAHAEAMRRDGLTIESADGASVVRVTVRTDIADVGLRDDDCVLLAMKSQDTLGAVGALRSAAPPGLAVVCVQNGVENERAAQRFLDRVYGVCVMCPAGHLRPGVVEAHSTPVAGLMDVGCYPAGVDATAESIASTFTDAGFDSVARPDIMRWKHGKLLLNLTNAIEALCGAPARRGPLGRLVREEGEACLRAAGIAFTTRDEEKARRGELLDIRRIGDRARTGSSTWQSLHRRTGSVETDYLNGEIVLLGRSHGVAVPANALLQRLAAEVAATGRGPGSISAEDVLRQLGHPAEPADA